jgi:hypothetical protein
MIDTETGDLILFHGQSWYSYVLEWLGRSRISHVGMIVRTPEKYGISIAIPSASSCYVWHSAAGISAETGEYVFGVHVETLESVLDTYHEVWIRTIHAPRNALFDRRMQWIHGRVHQKPYDLDIADWLAAEFNVWFPMYPFTRGRSDRFWCSALVVFVLIHLGWVHENVDWTLMAPRELTEQGVALRWQVPVSSSVRIK